MRSASGSPILKEYDLALPEDMGPALPGGDAESQDTLGVAPTEPAKTIMRSRSAYIGLNYTRYTSTRTRRYLDILAVNRKHFSFYLGAGMQMDKCAFAIISSPSSWQ